MLLAPDELSDWLSPEFIADPHSGFRELRRSMPVHWNPRWKGWVLTTYDDASRALMDSALSVERVEARARRERSGATTVFSVLARFASFNDPPSHTTIRRLAARAFSNRAMKDWEVTVERIAAEVVGAAVGRGTVDIMQTVATWLPSFVMGELLGVPAEDRQILQSAADALMPLIHSAVSDQERVARADAAVGALREYLAVLLAERKRNPGPDVISYMLSGDHPFVEDIDQLLAASIELVFGGHETTRSLIGSCFLLLGTEEAALAELEANEAAIPTAVEEILRFESPLKGMGRIALDEREYGGMQVQRGDRVFIAVLSANRDDREFPNPDDFDIRRDPNRHLAFGKGLHHCLGAPLVRLEMKAFLRKLRPHLGSMSVDTSTTSWAPTLVNRSLDRLEVTFR